MASLDKSILRGHHPYRPFILIRIAQSFLLILLSLFITGFILVCNGIQVLSLPFILYDRVMVYRWHTYLAKLAWRLLYLSVTRVGGFQITYSGLSQLPDGENAYVISNHNGFMDVVPILGFSWEKSMMAFLKFFMKDSIKFFPVYGWAMYLMGMIPLKRNWSKDQHKFEKALDIYRFGQLPVYIVSFPEGSRIAHDKLQRSQIYAKEQGLPVLKHLLLPRSKGFVATVKSLRDSKVKALYNITLAYYNESRGFGVSPDLREIVLGNLGSCHCHVHIERILLDELPIDDNELSVWLFKQFEAKDALLEQIKDAFNALGC